MAGIKIQSQQRVKYRRNRNSVSALQPPREQTVGCSGLGEWLEPISLQLMWAPRFFKVRG